MVDSLAARLRRRRDIMKAAAARSISPSEDESEDESESEDEPEPEDESEDELDKANIGEMVLDDEVR